MHTAINITTNGSQRGMETSEIHDYENAFIRRESLL